VLTIGLTGGIASGKSTVTRILRELGATVIDADAIVREVQAPGTPVLAAIAAEFGADMIRSDGSLDRPALGRIIFADTSRRRQLEAIVIPSVRQRINSDLQHCRAQGMPVAVIDHPLLFEAGVSETVDQIWVVYVDRAMQLVRLIERDGLPPAEAEQRINAQMSIEKKRDRATLVIDNRGTLDETRRQVEEAWHAALAASH